MNTFIFAIVAVVAGGSLIAAAPIEDAQIFVGRYNLVGSDNFDAYMEKVGINAILRQMGNKATTATEISIDDSGVWTIRTISALKTTEQVFRLGTPFIEVTADGRTCNSIINKSGNRLIQDQDCSGTKSVIEREFTGGQMLITLTSGNVVAHRFYNKV